VNCRVLRVDRDDHRRDGFRAHQATVNRSTPSRQPARWSCAPSGAEGDRGRESRSKRSRCTQQDEGRGDPGDDCVIRSSGSSRRWGRSAEWGSTSRRGRSRCANDGDQHPGIFAAGEITTYPESSSHCDGVAAACNAVTRGALSLIQAPDRAGAQLEHGALRAEGRLARHLHNQRIDLREHLPPAPSVHSPESRRERLPSARSM